MNNQLIEIYQTKDVESALALVKRQTEAKASSLMPSFMNFISRRDNINAPFEYSTALSAIDNSPTNWSRGPNPFNIGSYGLGYYPHQNILHMIGFFTSNTTHDKSIHPFYNLSDYNKGLESWGSSLGLRILYVDIYVRDLLSAEKELEEYIKDEKHLAFLSGGKNYVEDDPIIPVLVDFQEYLEEKRKNKLREASDMGSNSALVISDADQYSAFTPRKIILVLKELINAITKDQLAHKGSRFESGHDENFKKACEVFCPQIFTYLLAEPTLTVRFGRMFNKIEILKSALNNYITERFSPISISLNNGFEGFLPFEKAKLMELLSEIKEVNAGATTPSSLELFNYYVVYHRLSLLKDNPNFSKDNAPFSRATDIKEDRKLINDIISEGPALVTYIKSMVFEYNKQQSAAKPQANNKDVYERLEDVLKVIDPSKTKFNLEKIKKESMDEFIVTKRNVTLLSHPDKTGSTLSASIDIDALRMLLQEILDKKQSNKMTPPKNN